MGQSIGLLELKSIPVGMETADEMLKAANVELLLSTPICPGKYIILVSGNVGAIKNSVEAGINKADTFLVGTHIINNVHESLPAAISGTAQVNKVSALGIIETISALSVVIAGDIAAKASNVQLIEIRIARGLGGKGFLILTGEISSVKAAVNSCINELKESGEITSYSVISSPHKDLIKSIL
ncbi:MAG: BMC domain-containing protein [Aminipila sp.]